MSTALSTFFLAVVYLFAYLEREMNMKEKSGSTKQEVAKTYKVTPRTVDNWMREGWLPYLKIGGKIVRFNLDDVDRAIARKFGRNGGAA